MRGLAPNALRGVAAASTLALAAGGCGGTRQDAKEPSGTFHVSIVRASFPPSQHVARSADMSIIVRNDGTQTVPDVAVTVNSFQYASQHPGLADPSRPVWIVDQAPAGGDSANVNTWALGALAPGHVQTFRWRVTPVRAGTHRIAFRVGAGLNGKARAELPGGGIPSGTFNVEISDQPPKVTVDPATGRVVGAPGGAGSSPTAGAGAQPTSP